MKNIICFDLIHGLDRLKSRKIALFHLFLALSGVAFFTCLGPLNIVKPMFLYKTVDLWSYIMPIVKYIGSKFNTVPSFFCFWAVLLDKVDDNVGP